jgi:protoporphyrinogen oxidase
VSQTTKVERIAILGGGISGLSAAWLLKRRGIDARVIEAADHVGGLARSFEWHGVKCDIAPHRFFTTDQETLNTFLKLVPMTAHKRKSKIFMNGRVIRDPINPLELVLKFPPATGIRLVWGFLFRPTLPQDSFESMALSTFGQGLYDFFFEPYTRKLFGVSPREISPAWGRQKLRASGLVDSLKRNSKTFFRGFYYPSRGGYQAISDAFHEPIRDSVMLNASVTGLDRVGDRVSAVRYQLDGREHVFACDRVISTIPSTTLGDMLGHEVKLRFKAIQIVYLNINRPRVMPHHWIYFGDGDVVINRMAEFKNFSHDHTAQDNTVLCAEVTVDTDTPVEDVLRVLERYGLVDRKEVLDTLTLPIKCGYPIYDRGYETARDDALAFFSGFKNLHLVGRNAEFRHIDADEDFAAANQLINTLCGGADVNGRAAGQESDV